MRRIGQCHRCGDCCRTGDPFAPRWPRHLRERCCTYFAEVDGVATCMARTMRDPPERVRRYLEMACYPHPTNPRNDRTYPRCGYRFVAVTDGD